MNARIPLLFTVLAVVFLSESTQAKGTTIQLSITGPGLEAPLHISDKLLTSANVWFGNFIDWNAGGVDPNANESFQYRIHFWVKFPRRADIQMKYVIWYQWDDQLNRAIVCLPGQRDPWYYVNVYSILREGADGSCFYADSDWGKAVRDALHLRE